MNQTEKKIFFPKSKIIIELFGVMVLTYLGCWATIFKDINLLNQTGVGLTQGLVLTIFTYLAYDISGAIFNPAITLGLALIQKFDWTKALFYIAAQFLGGIIGTGFIFIQMNESLADKLKSKSILGIPMPSNPNYGNSCFWAELFGSFMFTYIFMDLIFHNKEKNSKLIGAPALGIFYFLSIVTIGEISGSGLNPARSIGPAVVNGSFGYIQFVHLFGSTFGCVLSTVIYNSVFIDGEFDEKDPVPAKTAVEYDKAKKEIELH